MSKPRLRYDVILLDEAQDTNPVTLELVLAQKARASIVFVGDRHQGIYGFRKALNAMELVEADERIALTQSFRFGEGVAQVASLLLSSFKGEKSVVKGREDMDVRWELDRGRHYAVVSRTNAELFSTAAMEVWSHPLRKLHFVGGFESYLFGKVLDAYYLWADERSRIKDESIARFSRWSDFEVYGDEAGDCEVKALVKVVGAFGTQIPTLYEAMKESDTPVAERADLTLTTAHKAKGLEWEQVHLTDDFVDVADIDEDTDLEEVNLLYVALTRAITALRLPVGLCAWLESVGFDGPISAPEQAEQERRGGPSQDEGSRSVVLEWLAANAHRLSDQTVGEMQALLGDLVRDAEVQR